jgi:excisionase family DNA binding protein
MTPDILSLPARPEPVAPVVAAAPGLTPLLLDLDQAAAYLGTSTRSLKRSISAGQLPRGAVVRPFGRRRLFNRLVLEKWVRDGMRPVRLRGRRRG